MTVGDALVRHRVGRVPERTRITLTWNPFCLDRRFIRAVASEIAVAKAGGAENGLYGGSALRFISIDLRTCPTILAQLRVDV